MCTLDGRFVIDGTSVDSFHFWHRYIGQHFLEFDYFPQFSVGIALDPFNYYVSIFQGVRNWSFLPILSAESMLNMAVRVVEFSNSKGIWIGRFLPKNQHTQKKLLNFEFWINGNLAKIGHHYCNKVISKLTLPKNVNNNKDSDDFWHRKLTLKVIFWHFLTAPHYSNPQNSIIFFGYLYS